MQMNMNQNMSLNVSMTLGLMLNPRMLQMLKILNLPYVELVEKINSEAEINPVIEIDKKDAMMEYLRFSAASPYKKAFDLSGGEKSSDIENMLSKGLDLGDVLISQIDLIELPKDKKDIAVYLAGCIDEKGYLAEYEKIKVKIINEFNVGSDMVDEALEIIQSLEPDGIGARDVKECLKIQVREHNFENEEIQTIIEKAIDRHLENIAENRLDIIADDLTLSKDGVEEIIYFIKNNLNPYPGSKFGEKASVAIPSFAVSNKNGELKVENIEEKYGPQIKFNPQYLKMLDDPKTDPETVKYLEEKIKSAKLLMENIEKRRQTIEKVVNAIIEKQKDYILKKADFPSPLLQRELSDLFGVHPSTISRAICEKYIETPLGIIKLKTLCPREYKGFTAQNIGKVLNEIVSSEDKLNPLTDEELKLRLEDKGIKLKRRTIADYRKQFSINVSRHRGNHNA